MLPTMKQIGIGALVLATATACGLSSDESKVSQPSPTAVRIDETPREVAPLTADELKLIQTDPSELNMEQRKKRAYALQRKVLADPTSPAARTIQDLREAHRAGDVVITPPNAGVTFALPGHSPDHARPPAGWRPDNTPTTEATPPPAP